MLAKNVDSVLFLNSEPLSVRKILIDEHKSSVLIRWIMAVGMSDFSLT